MTQEIRSARDRARSPCDNHRAATFVRRMPLRCPGAVINSARRRRPSGRRISIAIDRAYLPGEGEFTLDGSSSTGIVVVERGAISLDFASAALQPGDAAGLAADGQVHGRVESHEPAVVQTIRIA